MNATITRVVVVASAFLLGAALISTSLRTSIMDRPGLEANVRAVTRQPAVRSYLAAELSQAVLMRADDRLFAAAPVFAMGLTAEGGSPLLQIVPFVLILAIFYFIILLPSKRDRKSVV